jgi:exo-beta-1,3-glucanase (GH17 family)
VQVATKNFMQALIALIPIAASVFAIWAWLGRPIAMPDVAGGRLECLSYTPSHDGGSPLDTEFTAPKELIERDMALLAPLTGCIRTYSSLRSEGDVVAAAAKAGIQVWLGIWISTNDEANAKQIGRAVEITAAHPGTVRMIVVGNEVMLRREMPPEKLAGLIREVKQRTGHKVTYADIYEFWRRNAKVLGDAVDVVTIHVLPYWDDPTPVTIDAVQEHVRNIIAQARKTFPDRVLQIGEIGWPSAGRTRGGAAPSLVNEARFIREFAQQATSIGLPYNIIEGVDQSWKRVPEGTVGGYWGVLDSDRKAKFALTGPVSEWPEWPFAAAASVIGAILALGVIMAARQPLSFGGLAAVAASGALSVSVLYAFYDQASRFAIGLPGAIWTAYLLLIAALGGIAIVLHSGGLGALTARLVSAYRWLVLAPATVTALTMVMDGRHRDFLTLAFLLPAVALMLHDSRDRRISIAEGWVGAAILLCGPLAIDSPQNWESIAWGACCVALAWPQRQQISAEATRLYLALRQHQRRGEHGDA